MEVLCKVYDCRYNNTHVTKGHKCGKCGLYGHGIVECTNNILKSNLNQYSNDLLLYNDRCKYNNCRYNLLHKSEAHHCEKCGKLGHNKDKCVITIKCPICRINNNIKFDQKKIYGLTDTCSVCLTNNVEIYLPDCGHCCLCHECMMKI